MTLGLGISIWDVSPTKFVQMMILGWPWPTLWQGQICFLMHFNGNNLEKLIFNYYEYDDFGFNSIIQC